MYSSALILIYGGSLLQKKGFVHDPGAIFSSSERPERKLKAPAKQDSQQQLFEGRYITT